MSSTALLWQTKRMYRSAFEYVKKQESTKSGIYKLIRHEYGKQKIYVLVGVILWLLSGLLLMYLFEDYIFGGKESFFINYLTPCMWLFSLAVVCIYPYKTKRLSHINRYIKWYMKFYNKNVVPSKKEYTAFKRDFWRKQGE